MANKKWDKTKLVSRYVTEGAKSAPHRSYYYAMGLTEEEIHQPFVGVATCWNEAAPCNIALSRQAQAVKKGVKAAEGTPREFTTITVTDGIAMGHEGMRSSLVSRDIIADSVELAGIGDTLVIVPNGNVNILLTIDIAGTAAFGESFAVSLVNDTDVPAITVPKTRSVAASSVTIPLSVTVWVSAAIEIDPTEARTYNLRGLGYRIKKDYNKAIADFSKAIELNPEYSLAYENRGVCYSEKGDQKNAIFDFNKSIQFNLDNAEAYAHRGMAFARLGHPLGAAKDFDRALKIDPENPMVYFTKGEAYRVQKRNQKAIEEFSKAITLDPHYTNAYINLGALYLDVCKDRLYVEKADGILRRSAQTAIYNILDTLIVQSVIYHRVNTLKGVFGHNNITFMKTHPCISCHNIEK